MAFQRALDSGHPDQAPTAAVNLGVVRLGQGNPVGAAGAWQLVPGDRLRALRPGAGGGVLPGGGAPGLGRRPGGLEVHDRLRARRLRGAGEGSGRTLSERTIWLRRWWS
jgi:hypothetical protein